MSILSLEQYVLFDSGINLTRLREAQAELMQCTRAVNTLKGYAHSWGVFEKWCASVGHQALPTTPEILALFVAWALKERGYRLGTVNHTLSAVRHYHAEAGYDSPVTRDVRRLQSAARRALQEEPGGKAALTPEQILACCRAFDPDDDLHSRDRALLLLGFATGWRRSELSGLNLRDVSFVSAGLRLRLRRSKGDQEGKGRWVGIPFDACQETCAVTALDVWLKIRGQHEGPLFCRYNQGRKITDKRLSGPGICMVLKRALQRVGIDVRPYGAHSLRSGMITAAAEAGSSEIAIMQRTGHRSMAMVLRYIRPAEVFRADPLSGVFQRAAKALTNARRKRSRAHRNTP